MDGRDGWVIPLRLLRLSRIYVAVVAHYGLWELTPLTIFTMLTLLKRITLLTLTLCMKRKTLFYYDSLGQQELKDIAQMGFSSL